MINTAQKDVFLSASFAIAINMLCTLLNMAVILCWFYAIGSGLQSYLPEGAKTNVSRLRFFVLIPIVYITAIVVYAIMFSFRKSYAAAPPVAAVALGVILVLLLHLFSMFCIFYCMYTAARTLKSVELKRKATFSDCVGEFFLLWFFPIGVWIIQPRVNKIIAREPEAGMDIFYT